MVKVYIHLEDGGKYGKVEILPGATFAELYAAWKRQQGKIDQFYEQCESEDWTPERDELMAFKVNCKAAIETEIWKVEIATLDELKMLAEIDATYDGSEHPAPGVLGDAVLRILGKYQPSAEPAAPPALFSPSAVPRIGLTTGG